MKKHAPYVIKKDSLGPNKPNVDTYISRDHRYYHKNQWVKPKHSLILKHWDEDDLIYYHIKLPNYNTDHLIVNNVIMESWDGNY